MKKIKVKAPAKLNLNLHVSPQITKDGYHLIKSLNCSLALCDEIVLEEIGKEIEVVCSHPQVPRSEGNLCYQAALQLKKYLPRGVRIKIIKNIPVSAGLGGGSSDAAAVLQGLNRYWKLGLSEKTLLKIGRKIGMDVCYCLVGGVCRISGAGEKVKKLDLEMPKIFIVIVTPKVKKPSTAWVYQNVNLEKTGKNELRLGSLIKAIESKNIQKIAKNLHNDFEYSIASSYPGVDLIKKTLSGAGALKAMLCGSGLSVFGIFANEVSAREAYNRLKQRFENVFLTKTI